MVGWGQATIKNITYMSAIDYIAAFLINSFEIKLAECLTGF